MSSNHKPALSGMDNVNVQALRDRFADSLNVATQLAGREDWFSKRAAPSESGFNRLSSSLNNTFNDSSIRLRNRSSSRNRRRGTTAKKKVNMSVSAALAETLVTRERAGSNVDKNKLHRNNEAYGHQRNFSAPPVPGPKTPEDTPPARRATSPPEFPTTPEQPQSKVRSQFSSISTSSGVLKPAASIENTQLEGDEPVFGSSDDDLSVQEELPLAFSHTEETLDMPPSKFQIMALDGIKLSKSELRKADHYEASSYNFPSSSLSDPAGYSQIPAQIARLESFSDATRPIDFQSGQEDGTLHTDSALPQSADSNVRESLGDTIMEEVRLPVDPPPSLRKEKNVQKSETSGSDSKKLKPPNSSRMKRPPPPKRFTPERRRWQRVHKREKAGGGTSIAETKSVHEKEKKKESEEPSSRSIIAGVTAPEFTPPPPSRSPQSPFHRNNYSMPRGITARSKSTIHAVQSTHSLTSGREMPGPKALRHAISSRMLRDNSKIPPRFAKSPPASSPTRTKLASFLSPRPEASAAIYSPVSSFVDPSEPPTFVPPPPMAKPPSYLLEMRSADSAPSFAPHNETSDPQLADEVTEKDVESDEEAVVVDSEEALFDEAKLPIRKHRRSKALEKHIPIHLLGKRLLQRSLATEILVDTWSSSSPLPVHGSSVSGVEEKSSDVPSASELLKTVSFFNANGEPAVDKLRARHQILREMLESERTFVRYLRALVEVYFEPLMLESRRGGFVTEPDVDAIFGNVPALLALNEALLQKMEVLLLKESHVGSLTDQSMAVALVFIEHSALFRGYAFYASNHMQAFSTLLQLRAKNKDFQLFYDKAKTDPRCASQNLESLLIMPAQRIPRYEIFLKRLLKHTSPQHHDYEPLKRAVLLITDVNEDVESTMKIAESRNEVSSIEASFEGDISISSPSRRFILNTEVRLDDGRRQHKCRLFLFNNLLLLGKPKGRYKYIALARHPFTPHTKVEIVKKRNIVIKDRDSDGKPKTICHLCKFRSEAEAQDVKKQIDTNVRHIRHRTRPSIQQRRSNQRRSVEFVREVITGEMRLHTAPGRSVKRGAGRSFW